MFPSYDDCGQERGEGGGREAPGVTVQLLVQVLTNFSVLGGRYGSIWEGGGGMVVWGKLLGRMQGVYGTWLLS